MRGGLRPAARISFSVHHMAAWPNGPGLLLADVWSRSLRSVPPPAHPFPRDQDDGHRPVCSALWRAACRPGWASISTGLVAQLVRARA